MTPQQLANEYLRLWQLLRDLRYPPDKRLAVVDALMAGRKNNT